MARPFFHARDDEGRSVISLRTVAIMLGMLVFVGWAMHRVGHWTGLITLPLTSLAARVAAELDVREGRWG